MLFSLTVGKVDAGVAVLLTDDNRIIEFPTILLPDNIASGSIVDIRVSHNIQAQESRNVKFQSLQTHIYQTFGVISPSAPVLRCRNITQTSVVLEWDPIFLATAELRSLTLYRNGSKTGNIPKPMEMTATKVSGLALDSDYTFHLELRTTAGVYLSPKLNIRTHKMTDLSGVRITCGVMPSETRDDISATASRLGAQVIDTVRIDTTHFVCTEAKGAAWKAAQDLSIPVVHPEWLHECERQGRIVGVRNFYLETWKPSAHHAQRASQQVQVGPQHQQQQQQQQHQHQAPREQQQSQQQTPKQSQAEQGHHSEQQSHLNGHQQKPLPPVRGGDEEDNHNLTPFSGRNEPKHTANFSNVTRMSDFVPRDEYAVSPPSSSPSNVLTAMPAASGPGTATTPSLSSPFRPGGGGNSGGSGMNLHSSSTGGSRAGEGKESGGVGGIGSGSGEGGDEQRLHRDDDESLANMAHSPPLSPMDGTFRHDTLDGMAVWSTPSVNSDAKATPVSAVRSSSGSGSGSGPALPTPQIVLPDGEAEAEGGDESRSGGGDGDQVGSADDGVRSGSTAASTDSGESAGTATAVSTVTGGGESVDKGKETVMDEGLSDRFSEVSLK